MLPPDAAGPLPAEPVFEAPWQAKAFALTVALHERGVFAWSEWAEALARHCAGLAPAAGDAASSGDADAYYAAWMRALEEIVSAKGLSTTALVDETAEAWHRAAHATPHGQPIELRNGLRKDADEPAG